jgi:hypothetical protein
LNQRWEYKLILWTTFTEVRDDGRHPAGTPKNQRRVWQSKFEIKEAGKEPESRLSSSTYEEDSDAEKVKLEDLLAECGIEGWELVSETVMDTAFVGRSQGWSEVGSPIEIRWIMKRPAQPDASVDV